MSDKAETERRIKLLGEDAARYPCAEIWRHEANKREHNLLLFDLDDESVVAWDELKKKPDGISRC